MRMPFDEAMRLKDQMPKGLFRNVEKRAADEIWLCAIEVAEQYHGIPRKEQEMTKEDIIRMAREAGWKDLPTVQLAFAGFDLSYFASLVYEATFRDANIAASKTILDAAVLEEREACAKVWETHTVDDVLVGVGIAQSCAAAIRARSKE